MSMDKNNDRGEKSGDGFFEGRIRSKMVSFTGTVFLFSLLLVPGTYLFLKKSELSDEHN